MEDKAIEVVALGEGAEVLAGFWRVVIIEFNCDCSLGHLISWVLLQKRMNYRLTSVVSSATSTVDMM